MPAPADEWQTIGLLAAHETAMADLYSLYAVRLPELADFFNSLAKAEREHARAIADFSNLVNEGKIIVDPGRFPAPALLASIEFVKARMKEAQEKTLTPTEALSVAHDLEEGLLESRYFDTAAGDSIEIKMLLQRLALDTTKHRALVREIWEQTRPHTK